MLFFSLENLSWNCSFSYIRSHSYTTVPEYLGLDRLGRWVRGSRDLVRAHLPRKAWTTGELPFTFFPLREVEESQNLKMGSREDREAEKEEMFIVGLDAAYSWQQTLNFLLKLFSPAFLDIISPFFFLTSWFECLIYLRQSVYVGHKRDKRKWFFLWREFWLHSMGFNM